ncbi:hypothetical protein PIB30_069527 [Stylosanthes scabra]|uniref:Uncharacterized protein n=1 Tax=Stylosanthes scabra TaxID=79078 RepID=A0ABU6SNS3_9FABA|nr:hypothetical protein [Stylosanthes scabra]
MLKYRFVPNVWESRSPSLLTCTQSQSRPQLAFLFSSIFRLRRHWFRVQPPPLSLYHSLPVQPLSSPSLPSLCRHTFSSLVGAVRRADDCKTCIVVGMNRGLHTLELLDG